MIIFLGAKAFDATYAERIAMGLSKLLENGPCSASPDVSLFKAVERLAS